jgi:hypothetical protein
MKRNARDSRSETTNLMRAGATGQKQSHEKKEQYYG